MNLKDKFAVVTGVGSDIGKNAALDLAKAGADVALIDFDTKITSEIAEDIKALGQRALPICADVLEWESAKDALAQILSEFPRIDILFNNMGISGPLLSSHSEEPDLDWDLGWNWVIGARLKGAFFCCKAALEPMKAQNYGRIVNVAPIQNSEDESMLMPYSVSKASVVSMTKNLANEVSAYNIRVNAITPTVVETPILGDKAYQPLAPNLVIPEEVTEKTGWIRQEDSAGHQEEIASLLPLFTSEEVTFITGYCHDVSGPHSSPNPFGVRGVPTIDEDGAKITIEYTPPAHVGSWENVLHGGVISTLLDEAIILVGMASFRNAAFTASLEIQFHNPAPTCTKLIISANRTKMSRKIINVEANLALEDGTVCATGTGKVMCAA